MLYQLMLYLLISFICMWSGIIFYAFFPLPKNDSPVVIKRPFIFYLLTGLMVVTCFAQWSVLFLPLGHRAEIGLIVLLSLSTFLLKDRFYRSCRDMAFRLQKKGLAVAGIVVLLVMILMINAGPSMMDDTESYHVQMIKWAQEYGTVPGLVNLHFRYGFNSSWFISAGILCPSGAGGNHYLTLNGLLSCWLAIYLITKIMAMADPSSPLEKRASLSALFVLCAALVAWPMIRGNAATANYDFITTCCIIVLFSEIISSPDHTPGPEWILWPLYLCTVRIINFPLLALIIFPLWQSRAQIRSRLIAFTALAALLFMVPFFTRNVLLSGYPFYPSFAGDIFSFDWKADRQEMLRVMRFIKYFNRVSNMYQDIEWTSRLRFPYWIPAWYHYLVRYDKLLVALSLASYGATAVIIAANKFRAGNKAVIFFMSVMLLQLLAWFLIGPDPRFAYGPLLCGIIMLIFTVPGAITAQPWSAFTWVAFTGILLLSAGYTIRKYVTDARYRNIVLTRPLPKPATTTVMLGGIRLSIPEKTEGNWNARCYDLCLPCLYKVDPRLRARGKNISDGFRLEQP